MIEEQLIGMILAIIVVAIGLFFLFRGIICWYYKINERVRIANEQTNLMKQQIKLLQQLVGSNVSTLGTGQVTTKSNVSKKITPSKGSAPVNSSAVSGQSKEQALKGYKELLADGMISEEEFNKKKKDLLG